MDTKPQHTCMPRWHSVRSFVIVVQPTLDPSAETFMSVQYASPGRGGELVGVCGVCVCVACRVKDGLLGRREQLVWYF